jgi:spore coat polysaccharide biosynthesis protein SpsF
MFIIIIQARMGSTRLAGKVMKKILDKEIILWSYDRCLKSDANEVYIATSINKENDILKNLFIEKNIKYFRGSENDLLDRYYQLCLKNMHNNEDTKIIRITSDCPYVDTKMINDMINFYNNNDYDYIINHSKEGIIPEGSGIEIINFKSLEYLWKNENDVFFREHATGLLSKIDTYNNIIKKGEYIYIPKNINLDLMKNEKISIDTNDDYLKSIKIAKYFNNYEFTYDEILKYLEKEKINKMNYDEFEKFWSEDFGNNYTDRNNNDLIINNVELFKKILKNININNVFEIGCNRGLNLDAINIINKNIYLNGIELNKKAYDILLSRGICDKLYNDSIFNFNSENKYDFVFTKGVLIHINPDKLQDLYNKIYNMSNKYILIAEYYSRQFQEINYRGNQNKLFKKDFCGDIMNKYPDLKLIDYGFVYYRDPQYPLDDITWFLLEK